MIKVCKNPVFYLFQVFSNLIVIYNQKDFIIKGWHEGQLPRGRLSVSWLSECPYSGDIILKVYNMLPLGKVGKGFTGFNVVFMPTWELIIISKILITLLNVSPQKRVTMSSNKYDN
jgi:hypothetical protein